PAGTNGGVWRSTDALNATPTWTRTLSLATDQSSFAVNGNLVLFGANDNAAGGGRLRESTDGGLTWPTLLTAANGYCGSQCFYDLPIAVDPASDPVGSLGTVRIYIGGNAGTGAAAGIKVSNDNGATFTVDQTG